MCDCEKIDRGAQLFRMRAPHRHFETVASLGAAPELGIGGRQVWRCRGCGAWFALLRLPFKDEEDILVRARSEDWPSWDWAELAARAEECRWRGPGVDTKRLL